MTRYGAIKILEKDENSSISEISLSLYNRENHVTKIRVKLTLRNSTKFYREIVLCGSQEYLLC